MNVLRKEINRLLEQAETIRPAALRRSRREDALYATDLPSATTADITDWFLESIRAMGWEAARNGGWIELNRTVDVPPEGWTGFPAGTEVCCCRSLVRRNRATAPDAVEAGQAAVRKLLKAGEEGPGAFETACAALHREWAVRLREGRGIPAVSIRFFE